MKIQLLTSALGERNQQKNKKTSTLLRTQKKSQEHKKLNMYKKALKNTIY